MGGVDGFDYSFDYGFGYDNRKGPHKQSLICNLSIL